MHKYQYCPVISKTFTQHEKDKILIHEQEFNDLPNEIYNEIQILNR